MQSIHNTFKQAIRSGHKQIGLWSHLCSPISIEILADCGYDWLLLDMEHSPNDVSEVLAQLQAMKGGTATPIGFGKTDSTSPKTPCKSRTA